MTPAKGKICRDDHRITGTLHQFATQHLKPCSMTVNRLPLVYKRRRQSAGRRRMTDS
jgi:hypothetical protein